MSTTQTGGHTVGVVSSAAGTLQLCWPHARARSYAGETLELAGGPSEQPCDDCTCCYHAQDRIIPGLHYHDVAHTQSSWWRGFNNGVEGRVYCNYYPLRVDQAEYQAGYRAGASMHSVTERR